MTSVTGFVRGWQLEHVIKSASFRTRRDGDER